MCIWFVWLSKNVLLYIDTLSCDALGTGLPDIATQPNLQ